MVQQASSIIWISIIVYSITLTFSVRAFPFKEMPAKWIKPDKLWKWKIERNIEHAEDTRRIRKSEKYGKVYEEVKSKSSPYHDELEKRVFGPGGITNSGKTVDSFKETVLHVHNEYRQMHHSPHLHLDRTLTKQAQEYAKELSVLGFAQLRHSKGYNEKKYGENIFADCGKHVFPIDPVKYWYSQVCQYDFLTHKSKKRDRDVKNFIQVVWRGTEKVGIGRAIGLYNHKPCTYIVARYLRPRGQDGPQRNNVDIGDFNKEICKDSSYVGFGAIG